MPRIPNPLDRVFAVPGDVVGALRLVSSIARDTHRMAEHTEVLDRVAAATDALPQLREEMARVAEAVDRMDGRMASIESAMPVLVDVQKHLTTLPETMELLDRRLAELHGSMVSLLGAVTPLGRVASRLPGRRRRESQETLSD
jgi:predicted  nucleic acid-binding Zn-ribbon protein